MAGTELGAGDRLVSKTNRVTSGVGVGGLYLIITKCLTLRGKRWKAEMQITRSKTWPVNWCVWAGLSEEVIMAEP